MDRVALGALIVECGLHSGLILRDTFSPCFMLLSATWNALMGCLLPTSTTAPPRGDSAIVWLLPATLMAYSTALVCAKLVSC